MTVGNETGVAVIGGEINGVRENKWGQSKNQKIQAVFV